MCDKRKSKFTIATFIYLVQNTCMYDLACIFAACLAKSSKVSASVLDFSEPGWKESCTQTQKRCFYFLHIEGINCNISHLCPPVDKSISLILLAAAATFMTPSMQPYFYFHLIDHFKLKPSF